MDETMLPARSLTTVGLLVALGAVPSISAGPSTAIAQAAQAAPMIVTTDTPEYCLQLLDRVSELVRLAAAPVPREVTDLTTEGHRMCEHGQTRGGIMRLRSALVIMEKGDGTAYR
jgi:hypothetical protein